VKYEGDFVNYKRYIHKIAFWKQEKTNIFKFLSHSVNFLYFKVPTTVIWENILTTYSNNERFLSFCQYDWVYPLNWVSIVI
jgi:ABC-type uncharacterized transport system ATPase subunit